MLNKDMIYVLVTKLILSYFRTLALLSRKLSRVFAGHNLWDLFNPISFFCDTPVDYQYMCISVACERTKETRAAGVFYMSNTSVDMAQVICCRMRTCQVILKSKDLQMPDQKQICSFHLSIQQRFYKNLNTTVYFLHPKTICRIQINTLFIL